MGRKGVGKRVTQFNQRSLSFGRPETSSKRARVRVPALTPKQLAVQWGKDHACRVHKLSVCSARSRREIGRTSYVGKGNVSLSSFVRPENCYALPHAPQSMPCTRNGATVFYTRDSLNPFATPRNASWPSIVAFLQAFTTTHKQKLPTHCTEPDSKPKRTARSWPAARILCHLSEPKPRGRYPRQLHRRRHLPLP